MGGTQVPGFAAVARAALAHADALVARWLPGGRREGDEYVVRNPRRADRTPGSFKVNTRTGAWADFATGEAGGDLVALRAWLDGASQADAARALAGELGLGDTVPAPAPKANGHHPPAAQDEAWQPVVPVPDGAPAPPAAHPRLGRPVHVAEYRDAEGRLLGVIHRYEPPGERKQILPLVLCADGTRLSWRWRGFPKPRPLYGLELLAQRPGAPAVVVEGEPKCDAGRRLIGDRAVVVAWPGGAKAIKHVDWSPLAGRQVAIWPDADEPGIEAARWIADELRRVGARKVGTVNPPAGVPPGWDLADAEREGWTGAQVLARIREGTKEPIALGAGAGAARLRRDDPAPSHQPAEPPAPPASPPNGAPDPPVDDAPLPDDPGPGPLDDESVPFRALGHDRGRFFVWGREGQQVLELSARELERAGPLMQLAPLSWWEAFYPAREGFAMRAAANDLIRACHRVGVFDPARVRGRGAWLDDGRVVLHLGNRLLVDGVPHEVGGFPTACIYERARQLDVTLGEPLASAEAARLMDACMQVPWEDREGMGRLLAGWLVVAPVCGAISWRPHLWITSEHGAGKTWVLDNIVKPVLGPVALHVQSKTTEAGLRGELGLDARPVVFDEAETQNQRDRERLQQILDLARQASSEHGADILKGTQTGGVKRYRIRSCFAFSSINVALAQAADESRTIVLSIAPPADPVERDDGFARLKEIVAEVITPDFGARLLARTLRLLPVIQANAEAFASAIARQHGSRRLGDTLGAVLAGAWSLRSSRAVEAAEADRFIAEREWVRATAKRSASEPEWRRALLYLAQHELRFVNHNGRVDACSIGELCASVVGETADPVMSVSEARRVLVRIGIRVERDDQADGWAVWIATASEHLRRAFTDTPWASAWASVLLRAPGARRHPSRMVRFGHFVCAAVVIPQQVLSGGE
ncbi:hypothetical protein [Elioraea sp.]|uniref:hypothetical protein n=1 Tax=Elioraea sp. TaxID=2185103 RepID=UPI0021DCC31E|nr:hypothetical protein [Elioraea sp.]GIX10346.1 MAG: hypothetical protein KatS3mg116_2056 [Elioraea sp.]